MRIIYIDEAGISTSEPVAVVVGVIIDADKDWKNLNSYMGELIKSYIPADQQDGFVFHAKDVSAGNKIFANTELWPKDLRQDLIKEVLYARSILGFSAVIGVCRNKPHHVGQAHALMRHLMAYSSCVIGCEDYLRKFCDVQEVATIIAEDTPTARRHIKSVHSDLVSKNPSFPVFREYLPLQRIIDTVHFASKDSSPLLQFADACAFAFRRYLAGYGDAIEYIDAFYGPASSATKVQADHGDGYFTCIATSADVGQNRNV